MTPAHTKWTRTARWTLVCALLLADPGGAGAQALYSRAAAVAEIPPGTHNAQASVTIIDKRTLLVENFFYDGTAPLVYFYLGASDSHSAFEQGLQLDPLLDRAYSGETLVLRLPPGESLDAYQAISVWCARFKVNFSSASFVDPPRPALRAGWSADIPPGSHQVQGRVTVINERLLNVTDFTYDGNAPLVYFYLGTSDEYQAFVSGLQVPPELERAYTDESLVLVLPDGARTQDYGAVSVWCAQYLVNFSSASFAPPPAPKPTPALTPSWLAVLAFLLLWPRRARAKIPRS